MSLENMEEQYAITTTRISRFTVLLAVFPMIFSQLGIGNELISSLAKHLFSGIFLALALGLGS